MAANNSTIPILHSGTPEYAAYVRRHQDWLDRSRPVSAGGDGGAGAWEYGPAILIGPFQHQRYHPAEPTGAAWAQTSMVSAHLITAVTADGRPAYRVTCGSARYMPPSEEKLAKFISDATTAIRRREQTA